MIAWRVVEEFETKPPTALEALVLARALLSTSAAVRGMREALESIRYHSENQDMSHRTFRIKARECAEAALSLEGEDEQATRADDGPTAPISTDTKGTTNGNV